MVIKEEEILLLKQDDEPSRDAPFIDIYMIPSKICFFLIDGMFAMFWAYLVLFLTSVGLDVKEAGVIAGIRLFAATIATPIWGYLSDYTGYRKTIFFILCLGAAVTVLPLPWIATNNSIHHCNATAVEHNAPSPQPCQTKLFSSKLFVIMLSLISVCSMFTNPLHGVIDAFVMNAIQSSPTNAQYGRQRIVGALGFGLSNVFVGLAVDHVGALTTSIYSPVFYTAALMLALLGPAGIKVASQSKWEEKEEIKMKNVNQKKLLIELFRNFDVIIFIISAFIAGASSTVLNCFLYSLMNDEIHAPKVIMGLANGFAALGEVLVYPFAASVMRLVNGPTNAITLALFSYSLRFLLSIITKHIWLILPAQILNGFGFGLFWTAAAQHTEDIAPKAIYITAFSILSNSYFNIGGMVGNLVGGFIYGNYGGVILFASSASLCSVWVTVLVLYHNLFPICFRKQ